MLDQGGQKIFLGSLFPLIENLKVPEPKLAFSEVDPGTIEMEFAVMNITGAKGMCMNFSSRFSS